MLKHKRIPFTIANGASLSPAVDLGDLTPVAIEMPAAWTAAALSFQTSYDGATFQNKYQHDLTTAEYSLATAIPVTAAVNIILDPIDWLGIRSLKVRSGLSAAAVNQLGDRVGYIIAADMQMTITNGYATLAEFKAEMTAAGQTLSTDAGDDTVIETIIEDASRMIDVITCRWFYAYTQTRLFSVPEGRRIDLDADCLTITTLTNGNGTVLTTADYRLLPVNDGPKNAIELKATSSYIWEMSAAGDAAYVISAAGSWGYVDRTATDPASARVIRATRRAALSIARQMYRERFGDNLGGQVEVTAAGVVVTPAGAVPKSAYDLIRPYMKRL